MDKETLSKYGWVVIVIIVLVILMSFAAPFGQYFYDSTMKMVETLKNSTNIEQLFTPNNPSNEDNKKTTDYTLEQIEADEHLFAIGETQPEYVVAKFNADYTKVTITKNGENSDGRIARFADFNVDITQMLASGEFTEDFVILSPMAQHADTLKTANINQGVFVIGAASFYNCTNLTKLTLPESDCIFDALAFYGCSGLKELDMPEMTIENPPLMQYSFAKCSSLEKISFKNGEYVVYGGTFANCTSLKTIECSPDTIFGLAGGEAIHQGILPPFHNVSNITFFGYGKSSSGSSGELTPYEFVDAINEKYNNIAQYIDVSAEPQLTLEYITNTKQSHAESMLNPIKENLVAPIAELTGLSYTSAFHFALLSDSGETEDDALAIVNQGEEYSRAYINNNYIDDLSGGDTNIKTLDDWFYVNTGVHEKDAINYMETGSWNAAVFAQEYADEIKTDIDGLVADYDISYYSAVLIWIDKDVTYKESTLAQQGESELESYVNSYYKELFKSESGNDTIDTADEYFKYKIGTTAHDIAYYIEKGNWPA